MRAVLALEPRLARVLPVRSTPEERLIGLLHPAPHVLRHRGMDLPVVGAGRFQFGQLRGLLRVGGADALSASPPCRALLQGAARAQL